MEKDEKKKVTSKVKEKVKKATSKAKKPADKHGLEAPKKLKILVTVVERSKSDFYLSALEGFDVNMQTLVYAKGTASKDIASLMGLQDDNKAVILSIVKEDKIKEILATYEDKYFKTKRGKGIAFTIPISSVIGVMVYKFLLNVNEG